MLFIMRRWLSGLILGENQVSERLKEVAGQRPLNRSYHWGGFFFFWSLFLAAG